MKYIKRNIWEIINKNISFFERSNSKKPLFGININGQDHMKEYKETSKKIPKDRSLEPEDITISNQIYEVFSKDKSIRKRAINHHEKIINAVKDGNAKNARKAMHDHIIDVSKTIDKIDL